MKLMGHRGAKGEKPENTLSGFKHLLALGAKAVELDIHLSSDGKIMVFHDETLERTTNGSGYLSSYSLSELQKLDAGEGEKIPSLNEALDLLLTNDIEIQIEIKDPNTVEPLISLLKERGAKCIDQVIVISFDHRCILEVKNQIPKIRTTAILYGHPLDPCHIVKPAKADGLSVNLSFIDHTLVEKLKKEKFLVTVWNVNDDEQWDKIKKFKVDYIATDKPTFLINKMSSYKS